jgi:hypothetical protein
MNALRTLLVLMILVLYAYTAGVGFTHGWNLLPVFFGDMAAMTWPGQFNLDFLFLLMFSGLWLAWRHGFTPGGIALGLCGLVGGTAVLAPYLLIMTFRTRGDLRALLLGPQRAAP